MKLKVSSIGFFFLLISIPYIILVSKIGQISLPETEELTWALENSVLQAFGSTLVALVLGFLMALGLGKLDQRLPKTSASLLSYAVLLPSLLPPIFILLVVLSSIQPMPRGILGVSLVQGIMNAGLVAIIVKGKIQDRLLTLSEVSLVFGASFLQFWKAAVRAIGRDLIAISFFVFVVSFSSFSIPMIIGGGRGTTLEILIYEKIRISGDWGQALGLSLAQSLILFLFAFLPRSRPTGESSRATGNHLLFSTTGAVVALSYAGFFLFYIVLGWLTGWEKVAQVEGLLTEVISLLPLSFVLSFTIGLGVLILLLLTALLQPNLTLHRILIGFVAPSTALAGFAFLFLGSNQGQWVYPKYCFCFVSLMFTGLYRMGWDQDLLGLQKQIETAVVLGANRLQIFLEISLPQLAGRAAQTASIASLWALGDFALARILIGRDVTIAMISETLMSSYRVEAGLAITSLIIAIGLAQYFIFQGVAYVCRRKFS